MLCDSYYKGSLCLPFSYWFMQAAEHILSTLAMRPGPNLELPPPQLQSNACSAQPGAASQHTFIGLPPQQALPQQATIKPHPLRHAGIGESPQYKKRRRADMPSAGCPPEFAQTKAMKRQRTRSAAIVPDPDAVSVPMAIPQSKPSMQAGGESDGVEAQGNMHPTVPYPAALFKSCRVHKLTVSSFHMLDHQPLLCYSVCLRHERLIIFMLRFDTTVLLLQARPQKCTARGVCARPSCQELSIKLIKSNPLPASHMSPLPLNTMHMRYPSGTSLKQLSHPRSHHVLDAEICSLCLLAELTRQLQLLLHHLV